MIGQVLLICLVAFLIGGIGLYWGTRNAPPPVQIERKTKFIVYFLIVHVVLLTAYLGRIALATLFTLVLSMGAHELYRVLSLTRKSLSIPNLLIGAGYLFVGALLLPFILRAEPREVIFVYLVVAVFDGFSQVTGQLSGTHKLASWLSPGKTIEGATGGFLVAAVIALSTRRLVGLNAGWSLALCLVIAGAGLAGDLLGSRVKRRSRVKDFGWILPGHGGVLDRFDSFLGAAPVSLFLLHHLRL
jgi:phosphatidate cytidylyltransferase